MLDLWIQNGLVYDGSGSAPFRGDVAVEGGRIVQVGHFLQAQARRTVDAAGRFVTPGFVDIHRHADAAVFRTGFGEAELRQGLTTIVSGNCGLSAAPSAEPYADAVRQYLRPITGEIPPELPAGGMGEYLDALERGGLPLNAGMLVGGGTVRAGISGFADGELTPMQQRAVHGALERALSEGALGVSLGLGYAPECFYSPDALVRALEPLRGAKIPVTVHMRQEGDGMLEALAEMIRLARLLRVPVHISHLKAMGRGNWGTYAQEALLMLARARLEGLDVSCDAYPYTAGSTQLIHVLPPEFLAGGAQAVCRRLRDRKSRAELAGRLETGRDFENLVRLAGWDGIYVAGLRQPENAAFENRSLAQIAQMSGKTPLDACCDLLAGESCGVSMIDFMADDGDIADILRAPYANVISDATYPTEGRLHPRVFGAFSRILETFVRERHVLTPEEAVAKMTAVPAAVLGLRGKGRLAPGFDADINVFRLEKVHEHATYADPEQVSGGMDWVIVGGVPAIADGVRTKARSGRVLRGR